MNLQYVGTCAVANIYENKIIYEYGLQKIEKKNKIITNT